MVCDVAYVFEIMIMLLLAFDFYFFLPLVVVCTGYSLYSSVLVMDPFTFLVQASVEFLVGSIVLLFLRVMVLCAISLSHG